MDIKKYISNNYPTVKPFEGIRSVENELLEYKYLVVIDNDNNFHGILTTSDIIIHPHKIVIDCVTKKESITVDDTIVSALEKFYSNKSLVLPVMKGDDFIGVIEKNQILKSLEMKANELYDKSLISEKAKKYFLNNLSHEIRTPLNGMLGFIDIVSQLNANDIEINDEFSKSIQKSAAHFLLVMGDLVELSFLHAGDKISMQKDKVDIVKILTELKDYFDELSLLQDKKLTVVYSNSESSFYVYTDGKKLKHILYHLINNAMKFSEDSKVTYGFELNHNEKNVLFFVKNKDSNIDQKDAQKMFDIFEKQENIGNELNFGLGIGLPLVKSLTELLGGHIKMEIENKEISFFVKIPIEDHSENLWN
jgi:signal transduction histidine kinase